MHHKNHILCIDMGIIPTHTRILCPPGRSGGWPSRALRRPPEAAVWAVAGHPEAVTLLLPWLRSRMRSDSCNERNYHHIRDEFEHYMAFIDMLL